MLYLEPSKSKINPSDCVDMDCDGRRKLLVTDLDGTFLGKARTTFIAKSEWHWDGDRSWGLGNDLFLSIE